MNPTTDINAATPSRQDAEKIENVSAVPAGVFSPLSQEMFIVDFLGVSIGEPAGTADVL